MGVDLVEFVLEGCLMRALCVRAFVPMGLWQEGLTRLKWRAPAIEHRRTVGQLSRELALMHFRPLLPSGCRPSRQAIRWLIRAMLAAFWILDGFSDDADFVRDLQMG